MPADALPLDLQPSGASLASFRIVAHTFDEPPHTHSHGVLYGVLSGHVVSNSPGGRWLIPAGHVFWVPPGSSHGGTGAEVSGLSLWLGAELARLMPGDACVARMTDLLAALMERMATREAAVAPATSVECAMIQVVGDDLDRHRSVPLLCSMPRHPMMQKELGAWAETCSERIDLDGLARRCGISRRNFTRRFREETGDSFGEWRRRAQLICGLKMLAEGHSVTDTAYALGFESPTSFYLLCRTLTGLNPKSLARQTSRRAAFQPRGA